MARKDADPGRRRSDRNAITRLQSGVIAGVGPVLPVSIAESVTSCVSASLNEAAKVITETFDDDIQPFSTIEDQIRLLPIGQNREVNRSTIEQRVKYLNDRLSATIKFAQDQFKFRMRICLREYQPPAPGFSIVFTLRVCNGNQHGCETDSAGDTTRFEKLFEWLSRTNPAIVNRWEALDDTGQAIPADANLLEAYSGKQLWPNEPTADVLLTQFESLALANRKKPNITYVAPSMMRLSMAQGRQVLAATAAPGRALAQLRNTDQLEFASFTTDASGAVRSTVQTIKRPLASFKQWSDDIARARITECARFRGTGDPTLIGGCAGYKLDASSAQVVQDCLMGKRCLADPSEKAFASIASMIRYNAEEVEQRALALPKFAVAVTTTMGDFEQIAGTCLSQNRNDPSEASLCVVRANANPANAKMIDCLRAAKASGNSRSRDEKVPSRWNFRQPRQTTNRVRVKCWKDPERNCRVHFGERPATEGCRAPSNVFTD